MRWALALIILISLSLIAFFPGTYSLLKGTHTVTNISSVSNDISCNSCHSRIAQELNSSAYHTSLTCEDCHRNPYLGQKVAYDNGTVKTGEVAHAAVKPRCLDCHSQTSITLANGTTIAVPSARAFNQTNYGSDYSAHKRFVLDAQNSSLGVGENEACLSCHSDFNVKISFKRPLYYNFTVSSWVVTVNGYGNTNTTVVFKSGNGSKHTFKLLNQIKCESCHSDIWSAINHTEPSISGQTPNSSHVIWYWGGSSTAPQAPIHDISNIGTSYTNITDYCLSSCHNPVVSGANIPPELTATVHVARRLSCYSCHTDSYSFSVYDKTSGSYFPPPWSTAMDNLDANVFNVPLFLHSDTCISCKRAGAPNSGTFVSYSEPNNTIYYNGGKI